jgi:hypothetical protein
VGSLNTKAPANPLLPAEHAAVYAARRAQLEALTGVAMPEHGPAGYGSVHSGIAVGEAVRHLGGGWKMMPNVGPDLGLWQHLQQRADAVSGIVSPEYASALETAQKRALEAEKALAEERKLLPGRALAEACKALMAGSLVKSEVDALIKALDVMGHLNRNIVEEVRCLLLDDSLPADMVADLWNALVKVHPAPQKEGAAVEHVLDDLLHQRLVPGERKALRKALEQADRVPASTNEALGRAIRQR